MTMIRRPTTIPAGQFKARCLALLDEVAAGFAGRDVVARWCVIIGG